MSHRDVVAFFGVLRFLLRWPGRDVEAVVEIDQSVGPFDLPSIEGPSETTSKVVPLALTFGTERDFLRFLEANTRDAPAGEVLPFKATDAGMENLVALFPGQQPIERKMPLSAPDESDALASG